MGFRFQKRIKIAPGIRLNLSKTGVSTTIGKRGASVNIGKRGTYLNAGIPGSGLSYRHKLDSYDTILQQSSAAKKRILQQSLNSVSKTLYVIAVLGIFLIIGLSNSAIVTGIGLFFIVGIIIYRCMSDSHKAKPLVKLAENYSQEQMYKEAIDLLKQAYVIYPNDNIRQDIEYLQNFIDEE